MGVSRISQESQQGYAATYVYEPDSFRLVAQLRDGLVYHYHLDHLDHLGTPKEMTNEAGEIVWKGQYRTYGNVAVKEVEAVENNLRFQGQYFDAETGLHYNRHRYYHPETGQFISQDPIGLLGGVNNYQYAPNPTGWVDPLGLCEKSGGTNNEKLFGDLPSVDPRSKNRIEPAPGQILLTKDNLSDVKPNEPHIFAIDEGAICKWLYVDRRVKVG